MPGGYCFICHTEANLDSAMFEPSRQVQHIVDCPLCGQYQINDTSAKYLDYHVTSDGQRILLSHTIRKMQKHTDDRYPILNHEQVLKILKGTFPKPFEQMNHLILWLGDNSLGLGEKIQIDGKDLQVEIGTEIRAGVGTIIDHLVEKNLIDASKLMSAREEPNQWKVSLKMDGWEYYERLKQGSILSRKAFMAMQYGDKELDEVVSKYFRPAVKAAGFDLYRLDDVPKAGLIDDRLKVEIRTSRILIADLTHENRGAYWEAGFAQGLGKPVIYTCEASKFEKQYTHFDTNHHTTIKWDKNNLEQAAIDLKNTIRETLPDEAKLTDQ